MTRAGVLFLGIILLGMLSNCGTSLDDVDWQTMTTDAAIAHTVTDEIFKEVMERSLTGVIADSINGTGKVGKVNADSCSSVVWNDSGGVWPKTLIIDYNGNCLDYTSDVTFSGKMTIEYSNFFQSQGASARVSLENFRLIYNNGENLKITGNTVISVSGRTDGGTGSLEYSVTTTEGTITKSGGGVITFTSSRQIRWFDGEESSYIPNDKFLSWLCDDKYKEFFGTLSGTSSKLDNFTLKVTEPLTFQACCPFVQEGLMEINLDDDLIGNLDYSFDQDSTASCDPIARAVVSNVEHLVFPF